MKKEILHTSLKAVAIAMGVAVVVLNIMGSLPPATAAALPGLGLAALSIASLDRKLA